AGPEQKAVEKERLGQGHGPAPALGHLEANLRPDTQAGRVAQDRRGGDRHGGDDEDARVHGLTEQAESPEDERRAEGQPGRERRRRQRESPSSVLASGT